LEIIQSTADDILIQPYRLEPYLQKFQKLQKLNIGGDDVGDSCMEILGAFCKDLRLSRFKLITIVLHTYLPLFLFQRT
jgi:hypothetical protein